MNKAELTAAIVKKTGFTKKDAEKALGAITDVIADALAKGEGSNHRLRLFRSSQTPRPHCQEPAHRPAD